MIFLWMLLVIDMDWHRNGKTGSTDGTEWTGWSWNKALFPDPAGFISWLHDEQNLNTTLNLHPADGVFPKEDNYDALYADLAGRYSDIKADSLTNEDGTIRWNIENKDFYKAFFEHILRPHENIGVDFWWVDWQQWMIAQNEPNLGNTFWLNHVFFNDKKNCRQKIGRLSFIVGVGWVIIVILSVFGRLGSDFFFVGFSALFYSYRI